MRPPPDPSIVGVGGEGAALQALSARLTPSPSAAMPADLRTELIQRHPDAHRQRGGDAFERWN
jgi:hypothetical protein